jgi:NTP pyrophosphatase (non-canonical NTP hydrolase)
MNKSKNNDSNTPLSFFKETVKKFVKDRNWTQYHTPENLIQAIDIELAELSELFLFKNLTKEEILNDEELLERIKEELADVFIYLISFVNSLDLDLTSSFIDKMKKNNKKYSVREFRDGKYYKK